MSMPPRRPFDASFSRRPGHGSGPGGGLAPSVSSTAPMSLMGDYHHRRGGGGYPEEEDDMDYGGMGGGGVSSRSRSSFQDEEYESHHHHQFGGDERGDRIPRDKGPPSDFGRRVAVGGGPNNNNNGGGWRQRSPSPRFSPSKLFYSLCAIQVN